METCDLRGRRSQEATDWQNITAPFIAERRRVSDVTILHTSQQNIKKPRRTSKLWKISVRLKTTTTRLSGHLKLEDTMRSYKEVNFPIPTQFL